MASLVYLWSNRIEFPLYKRSFYKVWAKRFFTLPELIGRSLRKWQLTSMGAQIHKCAEIGKVDIQGKKENLSVGAFSLLGRVHLSLHDTIEIGERVCVNDGVRLLTGSHDVSDPMWNLVKSKIVIDDFAWIGMGAIILPGVQIGLGAVVGAGAVVSKSVPPYTIVVGNPARPVHKKRNKELYYNPCEFLAVNSAWLKG